jgi:hypothetical protein
MPIVAIVGASTDRTKFGNKAVRAYLRQGWDVRPVHPTESHVEGVPAVASLGDLRGPIDRVTFYLPPRVGIGLLSLVADLAPGEFWVNPGADSPELLDAARNLGLEPIQGCAILDVGESPAGL